MKKKIFIRVVAMLLVVVMGFSEGMLRMNANATEVTYAPYNGVDYASVILNDDAIDDNRYYALLKAQQMVTVQWTAPVTFSSWLTNTGTYYTTVATDGTRSDSSFLQGKTYVGIPYSMADHSADDVKWMNKISNVTSSSSLNTYYYSAYNKTTTAYGADCSYFVYQALKAGKTGYSFSYKTTAGIAGSGYFTKIATCSDYTNNTLDALFAKLKPGDIALKSGHVMLYVGRSGNQFAFFEASYPITRYKTYDLSHMISNGYTFYKFNGFKDVAPSKPNTNTGSTNKYDYVSGAYQVDTKTGETLNLRGGQGVEFDVLVEIPDLTKLIVTEVKDYWGKVTYNGLTGWISLLYCNYIGSAACDVTYCIDYPINHDEVTGSNLYLQGWTLDKHEIAKVTYSINGGEEVDTILSSRGDVASAYPAYPSANNSWTARVALEELKNGENTVTIYAYCSTGKKVEVGSRTVTYYCEEETVPETTEPETTVPETQPETTVPETEPETTVPETEPETTVPETQPETTVPETEPETMVPETEPETTVPEEETEVPTTSNPITSIFVCKTKDCIDYPQNHMEVNNGSVYVQGWTVDMHGIIKATYSINGGEEVAMNLATRPDVAAAYANYPAKNNSWTTNIATSELKEGNNTITFYAYCESGNKTTVGTRTVKFKKVADTTGPVISNVQITNKTENGYTVTCTVTDESALSHVYFPTWTATNGQDDIIWGLGTISGNTVTYRVDRYVHNDELKNYVTHIYAYDQLGNSGFGAVEGTINLK